MGYISKRPTKERRSFFEFMERHKTQGIVGGKILGKYLQNKNLRLKRDWGGTVPGVGLIANVKTKTGKRIAQISVKKRKVNWWAVD